MPTLHHRCKRPLRQLLGGIACLSALLRCERPSGHEAPPAALSESAPSESAPSEPAPLPPSPPASDPSASAPLAEPYGVVDGQAVQLFTLHNARGVRALVTNYGGVVVALEVPDRTGQLANVVLGYDRLEQYLAPGPYFGALIGRYANRIAGGAFEVDGQTVTVPVNSGTNSLHGGRRGFDKRVWQASPSRSALGERVELSYVSADGEEGYPGELRVNVAYTLTASDALVIDYSATTTRPTVVNLTHHGYFHLGGGGQGTVLGHLLRLNADRFTPVTRALIPTGEAREVAGTPFDFRTPVAIGARIESDDEQLRLANGYDHNFVLNGGGTGTLVWAASVLERASGRRMDVFTTEPGVQLYTGNFLGEAVRGRAGATYTRRGGICLEAQHFPDSPHQPGFPSTLLRPGQTYRQRTVYRFSTEGDTSLAPPAMPSL